MSDQNAQNAAELAAAEAAVLAAEAAAENGGVSSSKKVEIPKVEPKDEELVQKLVDARVAEQVAELKANLDKAYAIRDAAVKKANEFEQKEKAAQVARLKEEGKHKEAFEIEKAALQARLEAAEKRTTELSRDVSVRNALSGLPFRNTDANDMAYNEVVSQLTQNEHGDWVHRSGMSISDFVEAYAKTESKSFLFKTKANSGAGIPASPASQARAAVASESGANKSLFNMSQEEVLKLAREGKLPKR